jgi:hypothetical protein
LKGIISGDAYNVRDAYFEDWFTSEEIARLTALQVMGHQKGKTMPPPLTT